MEHDIKDICYKNIKILDEMNVNLINMTDKDDS
jgi:hypothetical protein